MHLFSIFIETGNANPVVVRWPFSILSQGISFMLNLITFKFRELRPAENAMIVIPLLAGRPIYLSHKP
jgi:hypothetical protein